MVREYPFPGSMGREQPKLSDQRGSRLRGRKQTHRLPWFRPKPPSEKSRRIGGQPLAVHTLQEKFTFFSFKRATHVRFNFQIQGGILR